MDRLWIKGARPVDKSPLREPVHNKPSPAPSLSTAYRPATKGGSGVINSTNTPYDYDLYI